MDNELLRFARLAMAMARRVVPPRLSKHADPTYHPASLLAVLLLWEHLRLTYRGVEDLLRLADRLRRLFGLRIVPDHSTLWWFGRRHLTPAFLAAALEETVGRAAGRLRGPRLVALDSTGLWLSHASRYFAWRAKRGRDQRSRAVLSTAEVGVGDVGRAAAPARAAGQARPERRLRRPRPARRSGRRTPSSLSSGWWPTPGTTARRTTASAARTSASTA
jgi:hypothetical protein